jgi:hypothetical protein
MQNPASCKYLPKYEYESLMGEHNPIRVSYATLKISNGTAKALNTRTINNIEIF